MIELQDKEHRKPAKNLKKSAWALLAFDALVIALALGAFASGKNIGFIKQLSTFTFGLTLLFIPWLGIFYILDLYKPYTSHVGVSVLGRIVIANLGYAIFILSASSFTFFPLNTCGLTFLSKFLPTILYFFTLLVFSLASRFVVRKWVDHAASKSSWILMGYQNDLLPFFSEFKKISISKNLYFTSLETNSIPLSSSELEEITHNHQIAPLNMEDINPFIKNNNVSGIVVVHRGEFSKSQTDFLMNLRLSGVSIYSLTDFYETFLQKIPSAYLRGEWTELSQEFDLLHNRFDLRIKRLSDLALAFILFFCTLPIMIIAAILVKLTSAGPVFYSQIRTGENEKPFKLFKFRSMRIGSDKLGDYTHKKDPRVTPIGKFLRLTRIDELPQIFNILKGDMSFIGPRAEWDKLADQYKQQIPFYNLRHVIKPGITGWAQVMYSYGASVDDARQKLAYDLYYIKNHSFLLDLIILFKTVRTVLLGRGQ